MYRLDVGVKTASRRDLLRACAVGGLVPSLCDAQIAALPALAAAAQLLGQLKATLDSFVNSTDYAASNRIHQIHLEASDLLREANDLLSKQVTELNRSVVRIFSQTQDLLVTLRATVKESQRQLYLDVNATLITVAHLLPKFLQGDSFVIAIDPPRIKPDAVDRDIFCYGFFPAISDGRPVEVEVAGGTLNAKRYAGHRIGFRLPAHAFREETYVEVKLVIPEQSRLYIIPWSSTIYDRIYVARRKPYLFEVSPEIENPDSWATLTAPRDAIYERADSNRTSNVQTLSAKDAFIRSFPNAAEYEVDTAEFVSVAHREASDGACEHVDRHAVYKGADSHNLSFDLYASSMPPHGTVFNFHGGGGSHADIWLTPTFRVRRKGVPENRVSSTLSAGCGKADIARFSLPANWRRATITAHFKDGDDDETETLVLTNTPNVASIPGGTKLFWNAEVNGETLIINTSAHHWA